MLNMNQPIECKTQIPFVMKPTSHSDAVLPGSIIALLLICFALLPIHVLGVVPPPDGGYPGGNTAEGQGALLNLTSGTFNTAVGFFSLRALTDGKFCTGVGAGALFANAADQNTAVGAGALLSNTTGENNTASGAFALTSNTTGQDNTATGVNALLSNIDGFRNNAVGINALSSHTTGAFNNAFGADALSSDTGGQANSAFGESALVHNTTGSDNTAIGFTALFGNTTGSENTAIGFAALGNTTTGNGNIALGSFTGGGVSTANNVICIGANVAGFNVDNSCFIGNIRDTLVAPDAAPVLIDSAGKLGTTSGSSRRFKKEIKLIDKASEAILALKPVTFHYKSDTTDTPQFGLIAEEVAEVNPDLVVRDKNGEIYTVRYDAVNAMLLNEFLKEHRKNEEQRATIGRLETTVAKQESGLQAVTARLEEQATQIQKVSAQLAAASPSGGGLEASKFATGRIRSGGPAPQVVNNP
jgi:uncharacterized coiled-coil protein SlyX